MRVRALFLAISFVAVLAATGVAQIAYGWAGGPIMTGTNLPSAAYPGGGPDPVGPLPLPPAGAMPPPVFPAGGLAINEIAGIVFASNGVLITQNPNFRYMPFTPAIPPLPGPFPLPPTPGPVTGLAYSAATGLLWFCTPGFVGAFVAAPPFAIAIPPAPVPVPAAGGPLTGIGVEAATGSLFMCSAGGMIFNHAAVAGVPPIGPQPVAFAPSPAGLPLIGLDVNDSNGPGSFPPFPCSTQLLGAHVVVTDGPFVIDAIPGLVPPIPAGPIALFGGGGGLAYSNDFQITFGKLPGGCFSSGVTPLAGTATPNKNGPTGLNAFRLVGAPAFSSCLMLADLCPLPGGALLGTGEILWINPFSFTFASFPAVATGAGSCTIPVSYIPAPAGVQFSVQWLVPDALHPLGFCLSDLCTVTIGMP